MGLWTIVAPWVVAGDVSTTKTVVNNVITGAIAALLAMAASAATRAAESRKARSGMTAPYPQHG
ncbi:SPW repeat protein [Streptomyces sp. NPDC086783]|uniref:SPW repeat protein n=1 Tax=Streptomyces sp. NPDC086783 TaxID=3365758 RepID=UPI0038225F2B